MACKDPVVKESPNYHWQVRLCVAFEDHYYYIWVPFDYVDLWSDNLLKVFPGSCIGYGGSASLQYVEFPQVPVLSPKISVIV